MFIGFCGNRSVHLIVKLAFFGFTEEVVKRALEEHRRVFDVFDKNPFSHLTAEERADKIAEMKKLRLQNLKRDFVVKNIKSSSKEHLRKSQKLLQHSVEIN